ncbi:MAG: adenylate/guanylate cyclase domain-containing protein [Deltaproteobacteria bacterium]|nr:adenylate/guanylate cyclase domain-containing protein [Deltaproteobacteria bacterium]
MAKLFGWMKDLPPAEEALALEMLKSERLRVGFLAITGAVVALISLCVATLVPAHDNPVVRVTNGKLPLQGVLIVLVGMALYEGLIFSIIGVALRRGVRPPEFVRFGNALIEVSLPTVVTIMLARTAGPAIALNSPAILIYFLFIGLSTLRLRFSLGLATGAAAAVQYLAVAVHYAAPWGSTTQLGFFGALEPCVGRALMMLLSGLAAGFVAGQIRKRVLASLALLEERNRLTSLFGQHVSPAVVDKLLAEGATPGTEMRTVSVLFLDIRGFTSYAEGRSPEEVVGYLNRLFGPLIGEVNRHGGIINKFLGDGFMAVFGAPLDDGRNAENAVEAGVAIARKVDELNRDGSIPTTRVGLGLHVGRAVTGSVGSADRKEYTIIGDTVNLAARVEQLNKQFASTFLVTEPVYQLVKQRYPGEELPTTEVKGRVGAVRLFRLL